jgi:hypothetical protein
MARASPFPVFVIAPRRVRDPLDANDGTNPSQPIKMLWCLEPSEVADLGDERSRDHKADAA